MEDTDVTQWRKSSYSSNGGGNCVEVGNDRAVLVRDTSDRQGPMLTFTVDAWQGFINGLK